MNNKILTISIAAYNVKDYIKEGLDSLVSSRYIDNLEVFVVDDGGQDETLAIAQEYQKKYPKSIFPIYKENGGYGTTVNYSMAHATGKYFKLLDGDDWFDTGALDNLIEELYNITTDVVITPYAKGTDRLSMELVSFQDCFNDKEQKINDIKLEKVFSMWSICYRTQIVRDIQLSLPEKLLYTDQYFALNPFAVVKTIRYFHYPVYQYRLGRDGQSVSRESRIKNIDMMVTICKSLAVFVSEQRQNPNYEYLLHRFSVTYRNTIKTFLLLPITRDNAERLNNFDNDIKYISEDLYYSFSKIEKSKKNRYLNLFIKLCRKTNYRVLPLIKLIYPKGFPNF